MPAKTKPQKNVPLKTASPLERLRAMKAEQRQVIVYVVLVIIALPFLFLTVNNIKRHSGQLKQQPFFKSNLQLENSELKESLNNLASTSQELNQQMELLDKLSSEMSTSEIEALLATTTNITSTP